MTFFAENPHSKGKKDFECNLTSERLDAQLQKMFTPRPFSQRWRRSNQAALVLSFLCTIFSGLTAFAIISFLTYLAFLPVLGFLLSVAISILISVLAVVILEALKRHSLNNFLRDVLQFGSFSILLFGLVLVLCSASVVVSFYGAKQLPTSLSYSTPPEKLDTNNIASDYNHRINKLEKEKYEYFENNKKKNAFGGYRLSSKLMPTYNKMIGDISALRTEKTNAIKEAQRKHETGLKKNEENDAALSDVLGYWALGVEIVFILSMMGTWLYYWNCYKERFSSDKNDSGNDPQTTPETIIVTDKNDNRPKPRSCGHCGQEYIYKHNKQKYCSDACRQKAWKTRTEKGVVNGSI